MKYKIEELEFTGHGQREAAPSKIDRLYAPEMMAMKKYKIEELEFTGHEQREKVLSKIHRLCDKIPMARR